VIEQLSDPEFVLGLLQVLKVLRSTDGNYLEGLESALRRMCRIVLWAPLPSVPITWNFPIVFSLMRLPSKKPPCRFLRGMIPAPAEET
jgi:hypothetical protein